MRYLHPNPAIINNLDWASWKPASQILVDSKESFADSSVQEVAIVADFFSILAETGKEKPLEEEVCFDAADNSPYACEFLETVRAVLSNRLDSLGLSISVEGSKLKVQSIINSKFLLWSEVRQVRFDLCELFDTTHAIFDYSLLSRRVCLSLAAIIGHQCNFFEEGGLSVLERVEKNLLVGHRPGLMDLTPEEMAPENEWLLRLQCATETSCRKVGTHEEVLEISFLDPYRCHKQYLKFRAKPGESRGMLCLRSFRTLAETMCHEFVHILQSLWGQRSKYWQMEHDATFLEFTLFHILACDPSMGDIFYPGMLPIFMFDFQYRMKHFVRGFEESHWSCVSSWISSFGTQPPPIPGEYAKLFGPSAGSEDFGATEIDPDSWTAEDWQYFHKWCKAHGYSVEADTSPESCCSAPALQRTSSITVKMEPTSSGKTVLTLSQYPPSKFKSHVLYVMTPWSSYQGEASMKRLQVMLELIFKERTGDLDRPAHVPEDFLQTQTWISALTGEARGPDWCRSVLSKFTTTQGLTSSDADDLTKAMLDEKIMDTFQRWDKIGDGTIHRSELRALLQSLQPEIWSDSAVGCLLDAVDKNAGGRIQYANLVAWASASNSRCEG
mmetsp:Transcript_92033/g.173479  ORF Transcript_92033/g.173479 Transcript_92033/m.173479 type:complete len:612 (-) Transcript_92033:329-2164(-)